MFACPFTPAKSNGIREKQMRSKVDTCKNKDDWKSWQSMLNRYVIFFYRDPPSSRERFTSLASRDNQQCGGLPCTNSNWTVCSCAARRRRVSSRPFVWPKQRENQKSVTTRPSRTYRSIYHIPRLAAEKKGGLFLALNFGLIFFNLKWFEIVNYIYWI